jgi:hypothetical protein
MAPQPSIPEPSNNLPAPTPNTPVSTDSWDQEPAADRTPAVAAAVGQPLHRRRLLLLRAVVLTLLLALILHILTQHLRRLRGRVIAISARRRHIHIGRVTWVLVHRAGRSILRRRLMAARKARHHRQTQPKIKQAPIPSPRTSLALALFRLKTARFNRPNCRTGPNSVVHLRSPISSAIAIHRHG